MVLVWGGIARAEAPLSAIDWLSAPPVSSPSIEAPPVSAGAEVPEVAVTPLDAPRADAVGLLPAATSGLPVTLWERSTTATLAGLLDRLAERPLPALQALYHRLLLAEANPPPDTGPRARFLNARLATLRRYGAVEPALALVERAGGATPALFDAWFDLALLAGQEAPACAALARTPHLSRDTGARIYCLARAGEWETAALILRAAEAAGTLTETDATLLTLFLDPELIDEIPPPAPPEPMTPLRFRLFEAIGAPLGTRDLPRAFAMADLRGTAGWKAEIEAAERLAGTGAIAGERLFGLYTARRRAASGGVWERVAAVQALDAALEAGDAGAIARALPAMWAAAREVGLQTVLADIFAERLLDAPLDTATRPLGAEIVLLSAQPARVSEILPPATARERLLAGIARGAPQPADARTPLESAIARAFATGEPAPEHRALIEAGRLGEAILVAAAQLDAAAQRAAPAATGAALATLRALGLEETARRAALQALLAGAQP
ncbi:MAG: hypothetical protein H5U16_08970 [Roseovarius sp.]|nr:hypothetical protein [Roseovarius sp.]